MIQDPSTDSATFDVFADGYDAALAEGLAVSGEDKEYFAAGRVAWLGGLLNTRSLRPRSVLDFGCGTGSSTPMLQQLPGVQRVLGVDVSESSLAIARQRYETDAVTFQLSRGYLPDGHFELAFSNGVFHHIPLDRRAAAIDYVRRSLMPGGVFALWENNPWSPGARYVMSRIPFDRDAIMIWPGEARRLLRAAGFAVLVTDFAFVFPRALRLLRPLERPLSRFPLGAQYLVLAQRRD